MERRQAPRRRGSRPLCFTELNAAPCSLILNGQVIKLASHVWRECQYKHIRNKDQDQDLSGVLCTAWLVVSDPEPSPAAASTSLTPLKLSIRRLWLVNQHTCCVFSSAAAPIGDKMGIVHAWGPREQSSELEPAPTLSTHATTGSGPGHQQAAESASASANRSAAGTQYRGLREGPCWELCTVCDVMAQLVDARTGREVGLLKSEDKVVSAEVVFTWLDLVNVLLGLLLLALHLLATRPCRALLAYASRSSACAGAGAARLLHALRSVMRRAAHDWYRAMLRPCPGSQEQAPQDPWPATQAAAAATAAASQLSNPSSSGIASQWAVRHPVGTGLAAAEPGVAASGVRLNAAACAGAGAQPTEGQQPAAAGGTTEQPSLGRAEPDTSPAAAAAAVEAPGLVAVTAADMASFVSPAAAVQLPEWSGHVFACRGSMQSAVFCVAFATGLFAALLATGVVKVLADLYDTFA